MNSAVNVIEQVISERAPAVARHLGAVLYADTAADNGDGLQVTIWITRQSNTQVNGIFQYSKEHFRAAIVSKIQSVQGIDSATTGGQIIVHDLQIAGL